jgi:3',5'-cyclic AMP phosphodiesterase CpdA
MALTRRQWITASTGLVAGTAGVRTARANARGTAYRIAHITDVHITRDLDAPKGVAKLFAHMTADPAWKPDLVINSGDAVMAVDGNVTGSKAADQIAVWKDAVKASPAPIRSCLGNHDVWGGKEPTADVPAEKAGFHLMTDVLGMPAPYYSFEAGGWHVVALNSMCGWPKYGSLTPEHFDWLKADLKKTPNDVPVLVFSHLPIVSVTSSLYGDSCRKGNDNVVPGVWQHADCWAITEVFRRHPNVKLCLSGHMHTCDRCEYRGVWYVCGGAASGSWWAGSEYGFPPCYGHLDLLPDGTFDYRFVDYGWTARSWKGKQLPD